MSAAFRVAFNDVLSTRSERQKNADKWVQGRYGDILKAGNIDLEANMETAKNLSTSEFIEKVKTRGDWDFKSNKLLKNQFDSSLLDEFGNFHFGMVAAAQGFSLNSTVSGAGAYQAFIQTGGNKFDSFISITSSFAIGQDTSRVRREIMSGFSFGDNPGDSFNIMLGWDYFHINQTDTFQR